MFFTLVGGSEWDLLEMGAALTGTSSTLFGNNDHTSVSRGVAEFLSRRPVLITAPNETLLALPVEGLDSRRLTEFIALCAPSVPQLVITSRRAHALGMDAKSPMAIPSSLSPTFPLRPAKRAQSALATISAPFAPTSTWRVRWSHRPRQRCYSEFHSVRNCIGRSSPPRRSRSTTFISTPAAPRLFDLNA